MRGAQKAGTENAPTASEGLVNAYRQLTRREVDRILKLISASVAGPYVSNTMVRQMLRGIVLARRAREISAIGVGVGANGLLKPGPNIEGGIPYVRVLDIKQSRLPAQQSLRTSNEIAEQYRRSTLRSGDILVTIRGTVGRTCVVPDELAGANITQDTAMRNILRSTFAAKKPYSAKSGEDHE